MAKEKRTFKDEVVNSSTGGNVITSAGAAPAAAADIISGAGRINSKPAVSSDYLNSDGTVDTWALQGAEANGLLTAQQIADYREADYLPPSGFNFWNSYYDPTSGWNLAGYGGAGWKADVENGVQRAINNDEEFQAAYETFIRRNGAEQGLTDMQIDDEIANLSWNNGGSINDDRIGNPARQANNSYPGTSFPTYEGYNGNIPTYLGASAASDRPTYQGYGGAMPTYQGSAYESKYGDAIDQLVNDYMNRGAFSYDYTQDPLYKTYADEYARLGKRAMDDTTAKIAARTGGLASSYAATAGNQAYGNYMAALANKVPELYQLAYEMYNNEGNQMLNRLNTLRGMESDAYSRFSDDRNFGWNQYLAALDQYNADKNFDYNQYLTELGQYNTDRNFDWNKYLAELDQYNTDRNFNWNQYLAMLNQANLDREYSDSRSDADYQKKLNAATLLYQMTGDPSALSEVYGLPGLYDASRTVYAYSNDGGEPYKIGSAAGLNYLQTLPAGSSVKGGDGSTWTKNADGTITISNNGKTWTYGTPTGGGVGGEGGNGGAIDLSTDIGKEVAAIPGAIGKYLNRWDDMDAETKYVALVTSGVDTGVALRLSSSGDRYQVQQALSDVSQAQSGGAAGNTMLSESEFNKAKKNGEAWTDGLETYDDYVRDFRAYINS